MARIVESTEEHGLERIPPLGTKPRTQGGAITLAAVEVADFVEAKYLCVFTESGDSARRMSRLRSNIPMLAFTPDPAIRRRMALTWGVESFLVERVTHTDQMFIQVDDVLLGHRLAEIGDKVVVISGFPSRNPRLHQRHARARRRRGAHRRYRSRVPGSGPQPCVPTCNLQAIHCEGKPAGTIEVWTSHRPPRSITGSIPASDAPPRWRWPTREWTSGSPGTRTRPEPSTTADEVRAHGQRAVVVQLDTTQVPRCGDAIDSLADGLGGVDVFVNNAGTGGTVPLLDLGYDQWRQIVATNLDGAFARIQRAPAHGRRALDHGRRRRGVLPRVAPVTRRAGDDAPARLRPLRPVPAADGRAPRRRVPHPRARPPRVRPQRRAPSTRSTSPTSPHAAAAFIDDRGIERATLVGNSMGCPVISEFACHYPDRIDRAILVSPAGGLYNQPLQRAMTQLARDGVREPTRLMPVAVPDYLRFGVPSTPACSGH